MNGPSLARSDDLAWITELVSIGDLSFTLGGVPTKFRHEKDT